MVAKNAPIVFVPGHVSARKFWQSTDSVLKSAGEENCMMPVLLMFVLPVQYNPLQFGQKITMHEKSDNQTNLNFIEEPEPTLLRCHDSMPHTIH